MTVHRKDRIRQWIRETIQRLEQIADAYDREYDTAPWPARRGEPTPLTAAGYSDSTGQTAAIHRDWLEALAGEIADIRRQTLEVAGRLGARDHPQPQPARTCTHPGCQQPHVARDLCRTHYQRAYRQRTG